GGQSRGLFGRRRRRVLSPGPSKTTTTESSLLKVTSGELFWGSLIAIPSPERKTCAAPLGRRQRTKWRHTGRARERNNRGCGTLLAPPLTDLENEFSHNRTRKGTQNPKGDTLIFRSLAADKLKSAFVRALIASNEKSSGSEA